MNIYCWQYFKLKSEFIYVNTVFLYLNERFKYKGLCSKLILELKSKGIKDKKF